MTLGSESRNSMFGSLMFPSLSLKEFWVRFVHVVASKCSCQRKIENASLTSFPELKMSNEIEKHAKNIYAHTNFYVFQM